MAEKSRTGVAAHDPLGVNTEQPQQQQQQQQQQPHPANNDDSDDNANSNSNDVTTTTSPISITAGSPTVATDFAIAGPSNISSPSSPSHPQIKITGCGTQDPKPSPESIKIEKFYNSHGLEFERLDDGSIKRLDNQIWDPKCSNFVVDFGHEHAWIGMNLKGGEDAQKLDKAGRDKRPYGMTTRWIAIFSPDKQKEFVISVMSKYNLSPRHMGSLLSAPGQGNLEIAQKLWHWSSVEYGESYLSIGFNTLHHVLSKKALKKARTMDSVKDLPGTLGSPRYESDEEDQAHRGFGRKLTSLFRRRKSGKEIIPMTNDPHQLNGRTPTFSTGSTNHTGYTGHSSHTGHTSHREDDKESIRSRELRDEQKAIRRKFLPRRRHFHRHHTSPSDASDLDGDSDSDTEPDFVFDIPSELADIHYHPKMLRLWHWLIICDDGTIISLHEPIPPLIDERGDRAEIKDVHRHVRRNLKTVLRCLSNVDLQKKNSAARNATAEAALEKGALVIRKNETDDSARPGQLYYFLFDDWYATWSLAVDRAHPYSKLLNEVRESHPEMHHINDLHDTIQRLSSLKRVYQSYESIIHRVLQHHKLVTEKASGVDLGLGAISRFERLKERITNLAMIEIENCEKEGEGLISLTYNRLNFIETKSVERLTKLTVALAKVTILFLPLSLITAFFSMQVEGITDRWNDKVFWGSMGVALLLTLIFLLFIDGVEDTMKKVRRNWKSAKTWHTEESRQHRKDRRKRREKARQREMTRNTPWMAP